MAAMAVLVFGNVLSRYLLNYSLIWIEELTRYMMVWVGFLGSGLVLRVGAHIAVDALQDALPRAAARAPGGGPGNARPVGGAFGPDAFGERASGPKAPPTAACQTTSRPSRMRCSSRSASVPSSTTMRSSSRAERPANGRFSQSCR